MQTTNLEILVKLKDEASGKLASIGKSLTSMKIPLAAVAAGAAAAGTAVVAFGVSAVNAFSDSQVAMARVDATLRSMGDAAFKNRDAILAAADAAVKLGFDDEDTAESITKLYQRTNDLNKATELTHLAMDLARAKSINLADATNLVGQVLSGNGRILKQYGIELNDSLTPLEALKQLQGQVAGQSDAFAGTFKGQMEVLSVSFQNIKEAIGEVLVDALLPFVQQFSAWLTNPVTQEKFKMWTAEFRSWAEVVIPVVIDTFKLWIDVLKEMFNILEKIGNTIVTIVNAMNNLSKNGTGGAKGLLDAWKNAGSNLKWAAGGGIPGLAEGGIVTRPTLAMVGEGGGPEAVIPLDKLNRMGVGGGVTVHINGGTYLSEDVAERIGDLIMNRLKLSNAI